MGKYEVTNGEYRKFKRDHDSQSYEGQSLNGDNQPVVYMNFDDAKEYADWLGHAIACRRKMNGWPLRNAGMGGNMSAPILRRFSD